MIPVLILCALAVSIDAAAYSPARCCAPVAYTAVLQESGGQIYMGNPLVTDFATLMTYDYNERMIRLDRKGYDNNMQPISYSLLQDYRKGVMYYMKDNVCSSSPLNIPFYPPCLPDDAVFSGRHVIGSYGSHLSIDAWSMPPKGNTTLTISVTSDDCLPVVTTMLGTYNGAPLQSVSVYTNVTAGGVDQSLFAVPSLYTSKKGEKIQHWLYRDSKFRRDEMKDEDP